MTTAFLLTAGFLALLAGSEALVRGAVALAQRLRVSPLLIGLTIVGFGTSMPELVTSVEAARLDSPGIAIGNIVGSNICNILLILGLAALLRPIPVARASVLRDGSVMMLAALAMAALVPLGALYRPVGLVFLYVLAVYLIATYRRERTASDPHDAGPNPPASRLAFALAAMLIGLALAALGAHFFVLGAIELARLLGVSESIIGLTVAAVGTSLPELAASVVAIIRRQPDLAYGNIVGSNIFNVFGILGVTALVEPIAMPADIAAFDVWIMLAASAALIAASVTGWRLTRREGAGFLATYGGYIAWLAVRS